MHPFEEGGFACMIETCTSNYYYIKGKAVENRLSSSVKQPNFNYS